MLDMTAIEELRDKADELLEAAVDAFYAYKDTRSAAALDRSELAIAEYAKAVEQLAAHAAARKCIPSAPFF